MDYKEPYNQCIGELKELQAQNKALQEELDWWHMLSRREVHNKHKNLQEYIKSLQGQNKALGERWKSQQEVLSKTRGSLDIQTKRADSLRKQLTEAEEQLKTGLIVCGSMRDEIVELHSQNKALEEQISDQQLAGEAMKRQYDDLKANQGKPSVERVAQIIYARKSWEGQGWVKKVAQKIVEELWK